MGVGCWREGDSGDTPTCEAREALVVKDTLQKDSCCDDPSSHPLALLWQPQPFRDSAVRGCVADGKSPP